jgi:hypothetical protein
VVILTTLFSLHVAKEICKQQENKMNDYFTAADAQEYTFYRIPKLLITDPAYRSLSVEAKVLYGLMLDRMGLSVQNGWLDDRGRVFIYYTIDAVREDLCCGKEKACKLQADLERAGLIERRRQGLTKPSMIYVKHFIQRSENPTSCGQNGEPTEVGKAESNKTEKNETEENEEDPLSERGG